MTTLPTTSPTQDVWGEQLVDWLLTQHTATGLHKLENSLGSIYNATDYGVPLNSSSSAPCHAAVDAFFTALRATGKPAIAYFPAGTYYMGAAATLTTSYSKIGILGATGCKFVLTGTSKIGCFVVGSQSGAPITDIVIDGIEIDGAQTRITTAGDGDALIQFWNCYRVLFRDSYIHDAHNTGVSFNGCGIVHASGITMQTTGANRMSYSGSAKSNAMDFYNQSTDATNYPARSILVENSTFRGVGDIGLLFHGSGVALVTATNVTVEQKVVGDVAAGAGIALEMESFDSVGNTKVAISNAHCSELSTGLSIHNTGNTHQFSAIAISNFNCSDSDTALILEGNGISVTGGVWENVGTGLSTQPDGSGSGATALANKDWSICGVTIRLKNSSGLFQPAAFNLILQANVLLDNVLISDCACRGSSTTQSGGTMSGIGHAGLYTLYNGSGAALTNLRVSGCSFVGFVEGVYLQHTHACELDGCTIRDNSDFGIVWPSGVKAYVHGGTITNNTSGNAQTTPSGSRIGNIGTNGWVGSIVSP